MNQQPLSNQADELARLSLAAREALTDAMVERLSATAANSLEVVDRLNDEETKEAVLNAIDRLTELHRTGGLDTLFDMVALLHAARSAATDSIVERMFTFLEHMLNTVGSEEMASLADDAKRSLDDAVAETNELQLSGGLFATLSMLSKPETQRSLQLLMTFGDKLRDRMNSSG
ncbi:MAG: hypothetical protein QF578_04340 [Alphaproteobacteria bacterium]|jgi:uncharacterized protein YjgD (DUF1641 family)|nr:hypothetical protein [Alphaproteobacteria bacterium]MDP6812229.1 hypothetical protein [Alphaproteobacteria bacterium]